MSLYDSVARHEAIEKIVTRTADKTQERKYWRFRFDRWYGGIVTADAVGCGLLCKFCWVSDTVMLKPASVGTFYNAERVAHILTEMAGKRGLQQMRVSGGEPTIGKKHLLELLEHLSGQNLLFILETNGLLIGGDQSYAEELSRYPFVHVRVSLKGCSEEEFGKLTGARPEGFLLQLKALENLAKRGVECHPAIMISFSPKKSLQALIARIHEIDPKLVKGVEMEELILYPSVQRKICKYSLNYHRAYSPKTVPKELV